MYPSIDIFIGKITNNGDIDWIKRFSSSSFEDVVNQILVDIDSNIVLIGNTKRNSYSADILLVKYNPYSGQLWSKAYDISPYDIGYSGSISPDGGLFIVGSSQHYPLDDGDGDGIGIKTDDTGAIVWAKKYGDILTESLNSVESTNDTGYIIGGKIMRYSTPPYITETSYYIKTDKSGNTDCYSVDTPVNFTPLSLQEISFSPSIISGGTTSNMVASFNSRGIPAILCETLHINKLNDLPDIIISPNPAKNAVEIRTSLIIKDILIYDLTGKIVKNGNNIFNNHYKIDLTEIPPGFYLLKLINSDKSFNVKKLIVY